MNHPAARDYSAWPQRPLDQLRPPDRGDELAAQVAVGGQRGVDAVRRDRLAELCPGGAVAVPRALGDTGSDVPGDRGEDNGIPAYADTQDHCWLMTWLFALWTVSLTRVERWSSSPLLGTSAAVG
jgi:hypothetical protein